MSRKLTARFKDLRLSITSKLVLGLSAIATILLLSSVISILEYRRMSDYVSDLIAVNINGINISQKLSNLADNQNFKILGAIGSHNPVIDFGDSDKAFIEYYDSLCVIFQDGDVRRQVDSVSYSCSAYMLTSLETSNILVSDLMDVNKWYSGMLLPRYYKVKSDIEKLNDLIYIRLKENSETFQAGFYRSIIPGIVSVGAGLILVLLFLVFIVIYYVKPLKGILIGVDDYRSVGKKYSLDFDGDDELIKLNDGIRDIIEENIVLRRRVSNRDGR